MTNGTEFPLDYVSFCMRSLYFIISLLLQIPHSKATEDDYHASATLRFNREFFMRAGNTTKRIIDLIAPEIPLPPINVTVLNYVNFYTRSMNLTEFEFPTTAFDISDHGLEWNSAGGVAAVALEFVFHAVPFTKTGFANISFADLRTDVTAIVTTKNQRPHFNVMRCEANLGQGNIEIDAEITGVILSQLNDYLVKYVRSVLKHDICLLLTSASDLANEFVEYQLEDIHVYKNVYLNYSADADPVFNHDYIEASCKFRADLIGNYSDSVCFDDSDSIERNITEKVAFSMNRSETWKRFMADAVALHRNALLLLVSVLLMRLIMWNFVFYFFFKCAVLLWDRFKTRKQLPEERSSLIPNEEIDAQIGYAVVEEPSDSSQNTIIVAADAV